MKILLRLMGGLHTALYRASKGRIGGAMGKAPMLLLTVKGRKTGKRGRRRCSTGATATDLVVVASVGGAPNNPAWFHNLQGPTRRGADRQGAVQGQGARGRGRGARAALDADGRYLAGLRRVPAEDDAADPGRGARTV